MQTGDVARKAGVLVLAKTLGTVFRIVAVVVLARVLSKEDFGLISFALLSYLTVSALAQMGLPESVFFFMGQFRDEQRRALVILLAKLLSAVALAGAAFLIALAWIGEARGYPVKPLILPLIALALLELPTMQIANVMITLDRARLLAAVLLSFSSILFLALVVPPLLRLPLTYIVYSLVLYGAVRLLVCLALFAHFFPSPGSAPLPPGMARQILRYAVPIGLAQVTWKLNEFIDKYVVMLFLPITVFAVYSVGSWEIPIVPMIATTVASVMMPTYVASHLQGRSGEILGLWFKSIDKISVMVLPAMVVLVVVARDLIVVLFSDKYLDAVLIFQIYTLVLFQRVADYAAILKAIDQTRAITQWAIYTLALNAVLSIPLVLVIGTTGPAIATLIATTLTWLYVLSKIAVALKCEFRRAFPFMLYARNLLVATAAALPVVALSYLYHSPPFAGLVWKPVLYAVVYIALSLVTGVLTRNDLRFFIRMLRPGRTARI